MICGFTHGVVCASPSSLCLPGWDSGGSRCSSVCGCGCWACELPPRWGCSASRCDRWFCGRGGGSQTSSCAEPSETSWSTGCRVPSPAFVLPEACVGPRTLRFSRVPGAAGGACPPRWSGYKFPVGVYCRGRCVREDIVITIDSLNWGEGCATLTLERNLSASCCFAKASSCTWPCTPGLLTVACECVPSDCPGCGLSPRAPACRLCAAAS